MSPPVFSGPQSTSSDSPITALAAQTGKVFKKGFLWNPSGSAAGYWSVDGGTTWIDFEAGSFSIELPGGFYDQGVQIKRVPTGSNVTNLKVILY